MKDIKNMKTKERRRIQRILAQTDWKKYWVEVANGVEPEIQAYDEARRKSHARAYDRVLR